MIVSELNRAYLEVIRANLVATLEANAKYQPEAAFSVLQRPDGMVYSDDPGVWTYDISNGKPFKDKASRDALGAVIVPIAFAESRIRSNLVELIAKIDVLLKNWKVPK